MSEPIQHAKSTASALWREPMSSIAVMDLCQFFRLPLTKLQPANSDALSPVATIRRRFLEFQVIFACCLSPGNDHLLIQQRPQVACPMQDALYTHAQIIHGKEDYIGSMRAGS